MFQAFFKHNIEKERLLQRQYMWSDIQNNSLTAFQQHLNKYDIII